MDKIFLIPRLALQSIRKNSAAYLPYVGACVFAMFTFFVFGLILNNDVMTTIPRAAYAQGLMMIGFILLAMIMVPFLFYTNSFLIKRRKRELGLYSILGMEKKHIGMMLFVETAVIYVIVEAAAVGLGLLFSKLLFLFLLNLAKVPAQADFAFSPKALSDTLVFFGVISLMNLVTNLWQVGKANPIELMSESRKGEKEPKAVWLWSILGVLAMGEGYRIALSAKIDSMIFANFFLAVFLVVVGTHFLFTSGSIVFLRFLKRKKNFYYRPENFITVSGMLYRMKKSAASLVNICIFATMVIITAVCTVSLYLGTPLINAFMYPYMAEANFLEAAMPEGEKEALLGKLEELAGQNQVSLAKSQYYSYVECSAARKDDAFVQSDGTEAFEARYRLKLMTLEEFNRLEQAQYSLESNECLLFSSGPDFLAEAGEGAEHTVRFGEQAFALKEELQECAVAPKAADNTFGGNYTAVVLDWETLSEVAAVYGVDADASRALKIEMTPEALVDFGAEAGNIEAQGAASNAEIAGGETGQAEKFWQQACQLVSGTPGFASFRDYREQILDMEAMYGGLLFIGIFFGLIFLICLLVIMYYKQITEGYEDRSGFEIMQKVGMSDKEVKSTIQKQILMVFFLPLLGAFCHTAVGMNLVIKLMGTLNLFEADLIIGCALGVSALFAAVYIFCYRRTAGTYYRIVQWQ